MRLLTLDAATVLTKSLSIKRFCKDLPQPFYPDICLVKALDGRSRQIFHKMKGNTRRQWGLFHSDLSIFDATTHV